MSSDSTGQCLVCGTATKNRCSACVRAGIDLFFCSPEHQKFVWPVHRYFCGPGKANPWTWPALTPDEAREALEKLDVEPNPGPLTQWRRVPSIGEMLPVTYGHVATPQALLNKYLTNTHQTDEFDSELAQLVRGRLFLLRFPAPPTPAPRAPTLPILLVMTSNVEAIPLGTRTDGWRTHLLHRLSVLTAWSHASPKSAQEIQAIKSPMEHYVLADIQRFLKEVAVPADPVQGQAVLRAFRVFADSFATGIRTA